LGVEILTNLPIYQHFQRFWKQIFWLLFEKPYLCSNFNSIHLNFKKMNKAQLIEAVAKDAKLTKAQAAKALGAVITATTKALGKGDRVALVGFGSFSVSKRAARKGRNPQTGKEIKIAAKKVVKFKAGAELAKKVK